MNIDAKSSSSGKREAVDKVPVAVPLRLWYGVASVCGQEFAVDEEMVKEDLFHILQMQLSAMQERDKMGTDADSRSILLADLKRESSMRAICMPSAGIPIFTSDDPD